MGFFTLGTNASYVENIENVELYEGEQRHKQVSFQAKQSQVVLPHRPHTHTVVIRVNADVVTLTGDGNLKNKPSHSIQTMRQQRFA